MDWNAIRQFLQNRFESLIRLVQVWFRRSRIVVRLWSTILYRNHIRPNWRRFRKWIRRSKKKLVVTCLRRYRKAKESKKMMHYMQNEKGGFIGSGFFWDLFRITLIFWFVVTTSIGGLFGVDPVSRALLFWLVMSVLILLIALPLIPGFVNLLANDPNENRPEIILPEGLDSIERTKRLRDVGTYKKSTFAFFTFLKPGQIKAIVRGQRFRRFIMRFDGYTFYGETTAGTSDDEAQPNRRKFWDVKETPDSEHDSHPIPDSIRKGYLDITWLWSKYVYKVTGAIFTGIPPFQTVLPYWLEKLEKGIQSDGNFFFIRAKDYSDHVRAAEFQFFVQIPAAETLDQVKVRLQIALTVMVKNPYRTIYETDFDWASRLFTAVTQEVSAQVRRLGYKNILAEAKGEERSNLRGPVLALNSDNAKTKRQRKKGELQREADTTIDEIGLFIKEFELIDADVSDQALAASLADVARSKADREAKENRAKGNAAAVDELAAAAKRHGSYGQQALGLEGRERIVAAAKPGTDLIVNLDGERGEPVDPKTVFLRNSITKGGE